MIVLKIMVIIKIITVVTIITTIIILVIIINMDMETKQTMDMTTINNNLNIIKANKHQQLMHLPKVILKFI